MDLVGLYIQSIRHDVLTREQEIELFKRLKKGDQEARQELIKKNLRLVVNYVKRNTKTNSEDFIDTIQEGNIGLMKAVDRFDLKFKVKFSTYATYWIKQSTIRFLKQNRLVHIPENVVELDYGIKKMCTKFFVMTGREPSEKEIADYFDITVRKVRDHTARVQLPVSLEAPIRNEDDEMLLGDSIASDSISHEEVTDNSIMNETIASILKTLPGRERVIIEHRFGLNGQEAKTLTTIGTEMGVSRERVRQIELKALVRIEQRTTETRRYKI